MTYMYTNLLSFTCDFVRVCSQYTLDCIHIQQRHLYREGQTKRFIFNHIHIESQPPFWTRPVLLELGQSAEADNISVQALLHR